MVITMDTPSLSMCLYPSFPKATLSHPSQLGMIRIIMPSLINLGLIINLDFFILLLMCAKRFSLFS